jgi:tetratricopeptide (TPR) repeat protein
LERYSQLAPDDASSHALLGDSLRYQADYAGARKQYAKALELDPDLREVAFNLATMDYMEGDHATAMEKLRAIIDNEDLIIRDRLDAMFPLASLLASRGNYSAAIALLERFADSLKEERIRVAMATSMQALFQLEQGHVAAARELARAAIQLSPAVPTRYLFARGLIELSTGEYAQATLTAQEIGNHALPPDNPDRTEEKAGAYLTGMALLGQGQLEAAMTQLEMARELEGYAYSIYGLGLARLMFMQGRTQEALELSAESITPDPVDPRLDLEPDRVRSILLQAEIHRAAGDAAGARKSALAFLERFDQAEPTHPSIQLAMEIAGGESQVTARKEKGDRMAALSAPR